MAVGVRVPPFAFATGDAMKGAKLADARGDAPGVTVRVTGGEGCRHTLEVTVPNALVEAERAAVTREHASKVKLRGFRKGRVPPGVIRKRFGPMIEEEAVGRAIRAACDEAISSRGLKPVTDVDVTEVRFGRVDPLTFKASFEARPEIPLGRLGGFRVERPRVEVREGAVDRIVERIRREHTVWRTSPKGRPEPGDSVTVWMTRLDGEGREGDESHRYDLTLGEGQALPDVEEAIRSLTTGQEGDFDVIFREGGDGEVPRDERRRMRIALVSRRVPELPEADDAFARAVGEFEDLEEMRGRIADDLAREARSRAEAEVDERLMAMVVEANPFEVPGSMVEGYTDTVIGEAVGLDPAELREAREGLRPASEFAVRRGLLVGRIADEYDLHATPAEVSAQVRALAKGAGEPAGRVRARLRETGGLRKLERRLTEAKLFRFLREQSRITEER